MKPGAPSLQHRIAELRTQFLEQLPQKIDRARNLLAQLDGSPRTDELSRLFHSLKGTGYTFGYSALAEIAGRAEQICRELQHSDPGSPEQHPLLDELHDLLEGLGELTDDFARSNMQAEFKQQLAAVQSVHQHRRTRHKHRQESRLIYLCDDEPDHITHLMYQLRCFGYRVEHFTDIADFEQAILDERPDAVIMDLRFPQGSTAGTQALGSLQQRLGLDIPSLVLSGRDDFEARLSAARVGCKAYFTKATKSLELTTALDELLDEDPEEPYRILLVDDETEVARYHSLILKEAGMIVYQLSQPRHILSALQEFRPDLMLVDMYMPECNGQELASVVRQLPEHLGLPIVYLSSETDRQKQFSAMRVGVEGFITKPIVPQELVTAVALRAERMRSLRALMVRDSLTGLYNHTTTTEMVRSAIAQARRQQEYLSMVMLDLDRFKNVNDSYGHIAGDQVLVALARLLRQRLRANDIIGRYGGEEFAILLPNTPPEAARRLVNHLREDFFRIRFSSDERVFHCTFSAGISAFPSCQDSERLRIAADNALYEAKRKGRNQVCMGHCDEQ